MGGLKRPKLRKSQLASGEEFYFFRRPATDRNTKHHTPRTPGPRLKKSASKEKKANKSND